MACDHCTIVHTGAIVEIPPPSYEEALEIIRKDAGSKLQEAPGSEFEGGEVHAIPLETLRGDPSKWIQPAPPQYSTAVRDVEVTQATGTGLSREFNLPFLQLCYCVTCTMEFYCRAHTPAVACMLHVCDCM